MKTISATVLLFVLVSATVAGSRLFSRSDVYVIGGEYVVRGGDSIPGDLRAVFAQVIVESGARVDGKITALSSALDIAGSVAGSITAIESDVTLRPTAQLNNNPQHVDAIPYVLLLPEMLRTGHAVR